MSSSEKSRPYAWQGRPPPASSKPARCTWTWCSPPGGGTTAVRRPDGDVRWWTWAGHRANDTLASVVSPQRRAYAHWIRLRDDLTHREWSDAAAQAQEGLTLPEIDESAVRGLKFARRFPSGSPRRHRPHVPWTRKAPA